MKRALASVASVVTLLSFATPAFASPNLMTRNPQPRIDRRAVKSATLASYLGRHNRTYTRARYNELVQGMMPSLLAVTGRASNTDLDKVARPGTRMIDDWTGTHHCVNRCTELGW